MSIQSKLRLLRLPGMPNCKSSSAVVVVASLVSAALPGSVLLPRMMQGQTQAAVQVPMQEGRHISLAVSIDGQPSAPICFDTGLGGGMVISSELAKSLNIRATGTTTLSDPTGAGAMQVSTGLVKSLQIGSLVFRDIQTTIQPDGPMTQECKGVLGLELFRDYLLTIDLPSGWLRLEHGNLAAGDSGTLPYMSDNGIPTVQMVVGSSTVQAHIDTMGPGLGLPSKTLTALHLSAPAEEIGRGRTVSGEFEIKGTVVNDTILLGPFSYKGSFVEFNDRFSIANLELAALRTFTISFDQTNHLVRFVARDKEIRIQPPGGRMAPRSMGQPQAGLIQDFDRGEEPTKSARN